uniref:CAAX prenyl protease 2 n=1 Tax=Fagus sylvatica TaxID=28930 RepID=A0A2N9EM01_FAGSY
MAACISCSQPLPFDARCLSLTGRLVHVVHYTAQPTVVLGVIYSIANKFQPLPEDVFRSDWREPFSLQKGWLLWAGIGLVGALSAVALTGVAMSFLSGESPQRETDALVRLLPLIGSSTISTACLLGITGVFAPLLEETVFRGFFLVSLTKCTIDHFFAHHS